MTTTSTGDGDWTSVVGSLTISDDVVIAHDVDLDGIVNMTGSLTINASKTLDTTGSNHALTVTGQVSVTGTLTGNASAITIGKMLEILGAGTYSAPNASGSTLIAGQPDGDYILRVHDGGTFTHNSGTLTISRSSASGSKYAKFDNETYNNIIIDETNTSGTSTVYIVGVLNVAGDLTITDGDFSSYGGTGAVDVDGDVLISSGGILNLNAGGVNPTASFGSLTIASGGSYIATSGTTTINGAGAGHSGQASACENQGTFTHNNGTILLSSAGDQDVEMDGTGNFYNLTINKSNNNVIMHPNVTIENNLDVTLAADHTLRAASTTNTVTVHGITSLTTGIIGGTTAYDGNHNWGTLQINSGTFTMGSGTNNVTAIRNIGGTIN
tara:strand:- start:63 stop:1211 length:1149 start_codon:yes stop_codon:yes gene_type:complete